MEIIILGATMIQEPGRIVFAGKIAVGIGTAKFLT